MFSPSNESRIIAYAVNLLSFAVLIYHVFDSPGVIPIIYAQLCVIPSCSRLRESLIYLVAPKKAKCCDSAMSSEEGKRPEVGRDPEREREGGRKRIDIPWIFPS